jgi:hypothetical protein
MSPTQVCRWLSQNACQYFTKFDFTLGQGQEAYPPSLRRRRMHNRWRALVLGAMPRRRMLLALGV